MTIYDTREGKRLVLNREQTGHWNRWGPFVADRAWGTVREDYSADGDAWNYFPHDHARSKAYRWNEDGIAGILRPPPVSVLRPGALERPRSVPQGATVRPERPGGQSRRGREGILLLSRQHADPLVHEVSSTSIRRRRSPTNGCWRKTGSATAASRNSNWSTPASSTRTATSMSSSNTPRPAPKTS